MRATVCAAGAGNAQIERASKIAGRQFLAFPCARRRARAVSALLEGMANAQVELNHQEYLRADRLAPRRSNSHSPPLPAHTIAPTAPRCSHSPGRDDWAAAVRRAPEARHHGALKRRGLPTATAVASEWGQSANRGSAGERVRRFEPSRAIGEEERQRAVVVPVWCALSAHERRVATMSERQKFPKRKFLKRDCGREGSDLLTRSPALPLPEDCPH